MIPTTLRTVILVQQLPEIIFNYNRVQTMMNLADVAVKVCEYKRAQGGSRPVSVKDHFGGEDLLSSTPMVFWTI
jgi:hypothetical protein